METLLVVLYFSILVFLSLHGTHLVWLLYQRWKHPAIPTPRPYSVDSEDLPKVTVQIPLYNEKAVARRILLSVVCLDYPKSLLEIQVLDDSTDETVRLVSEEVQRLREEGFRIHHLTRTDRKGFKAGALNAGMRIAQGEFVAIFDADFIPGPDFLLRVLPCFEDKKIGMAQVRWSHLNENSSWLTRLQALFLDGHFVMESETRDRAGLFLTFNGTAGIWRKQTILEAGGWSDDTLTEDLDLSYRAQLKGWKFRFLVDVEAPAELPTSVLSFKSQQYRWTRGQTETFRKLTLPLLRSHFPWRIKLEAMYHLTSHWVFPALVLLALCAYPALSIRLSESWWKLLILDLPLYILGVFSINLFYLWAQWKLYPNQLRRGLFLPGLLFLGTGLAVSNTTAIWRAYRGGSREFVRTPKAGDGPGSPYRPHASRTCLAEIVLTSYLILCVIDAMFRNLWGSVPFLLVFAAGFGAMGWGSLFERISPAPAPLTALIARTTEAGKTSSREVVS